MAKSLSRRLKPFLLQKYHGEWYLWHKLDGRDIGDFQHYLVNVACSWKYPKQWRIAAKRLLLQRRVKPGER